MTDVIALTGLRVRGTHGVLAHEKADGQEFVIDVALSVDVRPAAASDDLADTVDYGDLATRVAAVVAGPSLDLIETLAERIAVVALADPRVEQTTVTVHKPSAPVPLTFADISVTITRRQTRP